MTVAQTVAKFLKDIGIRHVYTVSGGANLHIIHAIADLNGIECIPMQNEQGASFAADACARLRGIGCCLATSGPGATNLITGLAASYYDSVPVLHIVGQVTTFRRADNYGGVRQFGFQETPIIPMVRDITKMAIEPADKLFVMPQMRACVVEMLSGRKSPALISIPDDIQRASL